MLTLTPTAYSFVAEKYIYDTQLIDSKHNSNLKTRQHDFFLSSRVTGRLVCRFRWFGSLPIAVKQGGMQHCKKTNQNKIKQRVGSNRINTNWWHLEQHIITWTKINCKTTTRSQYQYKGGWWGGWKKGQIKKNKYMERKGWLRIVVKRRQCAQDAMRVRNTGWERWKKDEKKTLGGSSRLSSCFACSLKDTTIIIIIIPMKAAEGIQLVYYLCKQQSHIGREEEKKIAVNKAK